MSEFAIELMPNQIGCREEPPPSAAELDRKKQRDTRASTVPPPPIMSRVTTSGATGNGVTGENGCLNSAANVMWSGHRAAFIPNAKNQLGKHLALGRSAQGKSVLRAHTGGRRSARRAMSAIAARRFTRADGNAWIDAAARADNSREYRARSRSFNKCRQYGPNRRSRPSPARAPRWHGSSRAGAASVHRRRAPACSRDLSRRCGACAHLHAFAALDRGVNRRRAEYAMARFAAMPDMTRRRRCGSRAAPTRHRGV